jgi:hypothetical protein
MEKKPQSIQQKVNRKQGVLSECSIGLSRQEQQAPLQLMKISIHTMFLIQL